ncbi:hypothetical protein HOLleu_14530 [Holothuria leucospilota]|uniref:Ig-like domain-containing protein n=1 Tax=Holothuria leucospilota TaxID=206669 RepID=A0A9Q1HBT0_HOLLE|nr:hypothetical protein HOLleu_14530 [Holothuria leucospilota]
MAIRSNGEMIGMVMTGVQLCTLYIYIFGIISVCKFRCCVADDKVFISMVTYIPTSTRTTKAVYNCYVNSPELDVTVSTRRVISTRESDPLNERNPEPPSPERVSHSSYPSGALVYWIDLRGFEEDFEFGTYACDASWNNGLADFTTSVSNVIMLSYARIYPADGMVTQTVNIGDNGTTIQMTLGNVAQDRLSWRHNEDSLPTQSTSNPGTYNIFGPIQKRDAGVYICYESDRFDEARHGMQRLIVRGVAKQIAGVLTALVSVITVTMEEFVMMRQGGASVLQDSWEQTV